ncbi:hypothetical protein F2Q70_00027265 [Brassica cretica]|uniref:CCHC-type domain-containing protein n=1 Tax=Brassica cretica TaxID=69181 RepID=A0A8S9LEV0_BRACR|nr:hypothetical protein F2Q70_00027265 [Brassica cretica]
MGDGELDTPQYITDDTDVGVFIRKRRAIEEVDLYVSIVRHSPGGKEDNLPRQLSRNMRKGGEDGGDNCMDEEDWHAFARSETPLTLLPTQKDVGGKDQEVPECSERHRRNSMTSRTTIPHGQHGIVIREPGETVRLAAPETEARQKGKNKWPLEYETDSDTDSDDAMVVPVLRESIPETANAARPVARRLALPEVADEFGQHWGKFDEALHEMLSDPYTLALFGKDAPPIFNSRRGTGKIYPVPSVGGIQIGSGTPNDLLPPAVRRPPGRPRKVRILSRGEYKKGGNSSSRKCKRCGRSGHNKASCRNPI